MRRLGLCLCPLLALAGCSNDAAGESGETATSGPDTDTGDESGVEDFGPVRGDLEITDIEISQSVVQPVYASGAVVSDYAIPVLANRFTIFRALWSTPEGWTPRPLVARLHVQLPDGSEQVFDDYQTAQGQPALVDSASVPSDLFSSFFWRLDPELVVPGIGFRVTVAELEDHAEIPASSGATAWPSAGFGAMQIEPDPSQIKVAIVGVRYTIPGCTTDTSVLPEDELEAIRAGFEVWNAVQTDAVQIDTGLSVDIDYEVGNVAQLLGVVGQIRGQFADTIPDAFFYIALDDCSPVPNGVLGIAPVNSHPPQMSDAATRYASGLWLPSDIVESVNTIVHEVGHNQGAEHAPCGVGNDYDQNYPHMGASIGVRGLDPLDGTMYSPNQHTDFMSYCRPYWVSDYRWGLSFEHQRIITSWETGDVVPEAPALAGYQGAVLVGLIQPGEAPSWWINTRPIAPRTSSEGPVRVRLEYARSAREVAVVTRELPDLPGARLVEIPIVDGLDLDALAAIRVVDGDRDVVSRTPEIRDLRGLKVELAPDSIFAR